MSELFILLIGISGVIAVAANFLLEAMNKLPKDHHLFSWINLYSAFALIIYSIFNEVWLFVWLNGFLILVGVYGLWKVYRK